MHTRDFSLEARKASVEGEFDVSLASDSPVRRADGFEVLSFEPGAVNLERARDGLPLLFGHDQSRLIGRVHNVTASGGRLRGRARFFDSTEGREAAAAVIGGHREVSIGYSVDAVEHKGDTVTVTKWTPYEASLVSIPADPRVGINRSIPIMTNETITPDISSETMSRSQRRAAAASVEAERERVSNLLEFGKAYAHLGGQEVAERAVREGHSVEQMRLALLDKVQTPAPSYTVEISGAPAYIRGGHQYSLGRAVRAMVDPGAPGAGLEREMSQELARRSRSAVRSGGMLVPFDAMFGPMHRERSQRGLLSSGGGGATIDTVIEANLFADVLRASSVCAALGARMLPGLEDNLAIPRKTAATTASWLTETGEAQSTDPNFDVITLSPKRVGAYTDISRQLAIQSSLEMEDVIRRDLSGTILQEIDRVALLGTGSSNQPRGIVNTAGIGAVVGGTNGAALNFGHILALEDAVANANGVQSLMNTGYAINPATRSKLKKTPKITGEVSAPIMGDTVPTNGLLVPLNGYNAAVSTQLPSNGTKGTGTALSTLIFGDFSELFIGQFGFGLELLVDPYTLATTGQVRVHANLFMDVAVRRPQSFAAMTDAVTA